MKRLLVVSLLVGLTVANRSSCGQPKHVHLAVGKYPSSSMTVSFSSEPCESDSMVPSGAVVFGTSPERMDNIVVAQEPAFRDNFLKFPHHDGRSRGNYTSGYYHHVLLENLKPNEKYFYRCVVFWGAFEEQSIAIKGGEGQEPETEDSGRSLRRKISKHLTSYQAKLAYFWTAPTPGTPVRKPRNVEGILKLAVLGDLGFSKRSKGTMARLSRQFSDISAVILAGDIAYTREKPENWDAWFDVIDAFPAFSHLPLQIAAGNHDIEIRPNGDIFVEYEKRFFMPQVREAKLKPYVSPSSPVEMAHVPYPLEYDYGNSYYSFIYGVSHNIVINSYSNFDPGSKQYKWIINELESVNRALTPWLFVTLHVPMYNTFHNHHKDIQLLKAKEHLESLFVKYKVNVVFSGHVHSYMRTHPVISDKVNAAGPVHIIVGDGGREVEALFKSEDPEVWVAARDATYFGYGTIEILNRTHSQWEWVHSGEENKTNHVWHPNHQRENDKWEDVTSPPVEHDKAYILNQFFL